MRKKCLVCGYEGFETLCPNCETLMIPRRRPMRKLFVEEASFDIPSESKICFGMWKVRKYSINGKNVFVCDCPAFVREGYCKHIRKIEQQQEIQEREDQREEDSREDILDLLLNT